MINQINVYNFGFGDCFLIIGNEGNRTYQMMVDCGSKTLRDPKVQKSLNSLRNHLCNSNNIGMITHFHDDHMNGVGELGKNTFESFYLPNFFSKSDIELALYTLALSSSRTVAHKFAREMLNIIPNLLTNNVIKNSGTVIFVKKDDKIIDNIEILWPEPNDSGVLDILSKIKIDLRYLGSGDNQNEIYEALSDLEKTIDLTVTLFVRMLDASSDQLIIRNDEENLYTSELIKKNIIKIQNFNIYFKLSADDLKYIRDIQNNYSLVFHKKEDSKNILFMGDICVDSYELIKSCLYSAYEIIKIPHHGTRPYYINDLVSCNRMIISNDCYSNWDLYSKYALRYPKSECICTNNKGCEIHSATNKPCYELKKHLDKSTNDTGAYCGFKPEFEPIKL